jgi:hypothetical protein
MALDAGNSQVDMPVVLLGHFLFEVAVFTAGSCGLLSRHPQLDHPLMRVMARNTVKDPMFTLVQVLILVVMEDETSFRIYLPRLSGLVAGSAFFSIPDDFHPDSARVLGM